MISHIFNSYARLLLQGVQDEVARQNAANRGTCRLVVFKGNVLNTPFNNMGFENVVYQSIGPGSVDALIVPANIYTTHLPPDQLANQLRSYQVGVTVCTGRALEGFPSVVIDPGQRLAELVTHLIEHHGRRKLAFFCGSPTNVDAQERLAIFQKVLGDHGLTVLPEHLLTGDFTFYGARSTLERLFATEAPPFDALVCGNDEMAVEAVKFFQRKGLRVPEDLAITGIDDIDQASLLLPQLTTVHEPHLASPGLPPLTEAIPSRLRLRSSCGCLAKLDTHEPLPIPPTFRYRPEILEAGAEQEAFLLEFQRFIETRIRAGDNTGLLQSYVFQFRTRVLRELADKVTPRNITDLLAEMQKIVAQLSQLVYAHYQEGFDDFARGLRTFVRMEQLIDWGAITTQLAEWLPKLDVSLLVIVTYPEPVVCNDEHTWVFPPTARVFHAWSRGQLLPLTEAERTFDPSRALLPQNVLSGVTQEQCLVNVLSFRNRQFACRYRRPSCSASTSRPCCRIISFTPAISAINALHC